MLKCDATPYFNIQNSLFIIYYSKFLIRNNELIIRPVNVCQTLAGIYLD
jgi:hypothetical protein